MHEHVNKCRSMFHVQPFAFYRLFPFWVICTSISTEWSDVCIFSCQDILSIIKAALLLSQHWWSICPAAQSTTIGLLADNCGRTALWHTSCEHKANSPNLCNALTVLVWVCTWQQSCALTECTCGLQHVVPRKITPVIAYFRVPYW